MKDQEQNKQATERRKNCDLKAGYGQHTSPNNERFDTSPPYVLRKALPWKNAKRLRRASLSVFSDRVFS